MRKSLFVLIFVTIGGLNEGMAQPSDGNLNGNLKEPIVGQPCPNFYFNDVDFYERKQAGLNDFKGKWVVLDFWDKYCSSCIASFPIISQEQDAFKKSIQFLMVTYQDKENEHRSLYSNYHKRLHLQMPCAFDSSIVKSFNVGTLPHIVIVDPNGIVRVVTSKVDNAQISSLLQGETPIFLPATYANNKEQLNNYKYDHRLPFMAYNNGDADTNFAFRSLLSKWRPGVPNVTNETITRYWIDRQEEGRCELIKCSIADLYIMAYTGCSKYYFRDDSSLDGKFWPSPIMNVRDSFLLRANSSTGENYYCYSLCVPESKATKESMMQIMQSDLRNYFGYSISIEKRMMPYYRLTATEEAKQRLKTKGGTPAIRVPVRWQSAILINQPFAHLVTITYRYSGLEHECIPLIDETGIEGNVDVSVDWFNGDFKSVKEALEKNGLDLVEGKKLMNVLTINDPQ